MDAPDLLFHAISTAGCRRSFNVRLFAGQVRHSWTSSSASARRKCAVGTPHQSYTKLHGLYAAAMLIGISPNYSAELEQAICCCSGNSASTLRSRIRKGKLDSSREDQQQAVATAYRREPLRGQRLEFCFAATPFREKPHGVKVSRQGPCTSKLSKGQ